MATWRLSVYLYLLLSAVCLGSCGSDLVNSGCLKVPISEFGGAVKSTMDVVQQVISLFSRFASTFGDFRLSNAIADCLDLLDLSSEQLNRTLSASQNPNGTYLLYPASFFQLLCNMLIQVLFFCFLLRD